jgi:hypothetical protein
MSIFSGKPMLVCAVASLALATGACTSTSSTRAKSLKTDAAQASALSDCENITVNNFTMPAKRSKDASVGVVFAQGIQARLSSDFGPLFASVVSAEQPRGLDHECVIHGNITKYKPGSRVARFILIGLGAASLEGNVTVTDGASGKVLLNAPFDKLWAWGGVMGASKGMDDMVAETSASVAATVAHAKGWNGAAAP